ncbi:unnamed protein product [Ectocarpus sp. 6 AP-2014]
MGNRASVSPYESSAAVSKEKPKAQQYREAGPHQTTPVAATSKNRNNDSPPKAPRPTRNEISPAGSTKAAEVVPEPSKDDIKVTEAASVTPRTETVPKKSVDYQELAPAADSGAAVEGDRPTPVDSGTDLRSSQRDAGVKQLNTSKQIELDERRSNISKDLQQEKKAARGSGEYRRRRVSTEETAGSEEKSSGSSGSESYTSSSYSSGSDESGDDASDDTFFVPADKVDGGIGEQSFDGGDGNDGGGGVVVRVIVDDNREGTNEAKPADGNNVPTVQKAGKPKRKRPANRHYIKDETMRTLFGLVPFYGGDGGPMDQMVKATLASVRPDAIDVRNEAGDTLLILACQHGCEDLVEPILAKGANPTAVNAVGICALHYTCFADSLSYDAAEALLWRGAETSTAETTYGCTPLHYAASSGDAEICALLVEHGAQPKASNATQDYYNYTAVKYAKDAGHEHVVELLGGEEEGEGWEEVEEAYTGMDTGEEGEASGPTGGLWIRHIDPQTELAYYMNDETGESWWETDLQAVAKEFLATVPATAGGVNGSKTGAVSASITLPPLGVREWLVQEQVRSWLVAIFSRADPLKLMEVDLAMKIGKADFKEMLQALIIRYGIKEMDFLREASSPKLEPLGVSSLIPSEDELCKTGAERSTPKTDGEQKTPATEDGAHVQPNQEAEEHRSSGEIAELVPAALTIRRHSSTSIDGIAAVGQQGGRDKDTTTATTTTTTTNNNNNNNGSSSNNRSLHRGASSQHNLKRVDSPAVLRAEADKVFQQEAVSRQENELAEERQRQASALNEQRKTLRSLEEDLRKREAAMSKTKEEAEEALSGVAKLRSALADDSSGQAASDSLSEEITKLKAGVAAEKVRLSHITETLEATKGSVEERAAKQQAQEEDRRVRLERLRSDNVAEVEKIRTDAADSLGKAEQAWDTERVELEGDLTEKVDRETALLKETVESAAQVLSETAATTKNATDAAKQATGKVDEARAWMKQHAEEHAGSKQIDQTNKQLHTSLRREMERAKQAS